MLNSKPNIITRFLHFFEGTSMSDSSANVIMVNVRAETEEDVVLSETPKEFYLMKNTTGEYEFIIAHTSLQEQKAEQAINNLPRDIEEQAKSIILLQASEGAIPPQTTQKSDSDSNGIDNEDDDVDEGIAQEEDVHQEQHQHQKRHQKHPHWRRRIGRQMS